MKTLSPISALALLTLLAAPAAAVVVTLPASRDNTLCQDTSGSSSNGAGSHFFVGRTDDGNRRRGLVAFDLSSIPAGATVNSVSLRLNMSRTQAGAVPVSLHRVSASWGQGTSNAGGEEGRCANAAAGDATWIHRASPASTWALAGGDFAATASATTSVGGEGAYTWSGAAMVADVQAWIRDPATNSGWLLLGNEAASQTTKRFDTIENADPATRPSLTVDYTAGTSPEPVVYQLDQRDPCQIIAPVNAVGQGPSPVSITPGTAMVLFYQVDADASCTTAGPTLIRLVQGSGETVVVEYQ